MISNTYAATEMTLRRFTSRGDATFHFFYDYGDGWEVVLRLEEVFEDSKLPGKELPRVLEGQGFGIIEDCGGPAGSGTLKRSVPAEIESRISVYAGVVGNIRSGSLCL